MVWSIILRFAVQDISEGDRTAKDGLLLWAQKKVHEGSNGRVQVKNFHTSWQDGAAFCALINAFRPDLMEFDKVQVTKDRATMEAQLNHAFDIADTHLGIPKVRASLPPPIPLMTLIWASRRCTHAEDEGAWEDPALTIIVIPWHSTTL